MNTIVNDDSILGLFFVFAFFVFPVFISFISLSCLTPLDSNSGAVSNIGGKSRHLLLSSKLRGKAFNILEKV